jgi:hypothetical protein
MARGSLIDDPADRDAPGEKDEIELLFEKRRGFGHPALDEGKIAGIECPLD